MIYLDSASTTKPKKEVIDAVKDKYKGTLKEELIKMKYEEKKDPIPICMKLHISQATLYSWRKEIINEAMLQAAYRQLFKPQEGI